MGDLGPRVRRGPGHVRRLRRVVRLRPLGDAARLVVRAVGAPCIGPEARCSRKWQDVSIRAVLGDIATRGGIPAAATKATNRGGFPLRWRGHFRGLGAIVVHGSLSRGRTSCLPAALPCEHRRCEAKRGVPVSAGAEGDDASHGVVGGHADRDAIAGHHFDSKPPHAPAQLCQHFLARFALHAVESTTVNGHNRPLHVNQIVFAQCFKIPGEYSITVPPQATNAGAVAQSPTDRRRFSGCSPTGRQTAAPPRLGCRPRLRRLIAPGAPGPRSRRPTGAVEGRR